MCEKQDTVDFHICISVPLKNITIKPVKPKHPEPAEVSENILPSDEPELIHFVKYDCINAELIRKAALKKRRGPELSGMDADGWRRVLL